MDPSLNAISTGRSRACHQRYRYCSLPSSRLLHHLTWAPAEVILEEEIDRELPPHIQEAEQGVNCTIHEIMIIWCNRNNQKPVVEGMLVG